MGRTSTGSIAPDSAAVELLKRHRSDLTLERLAEHGGVSVAQVSRSLAGLAPLNLGVVAVIRVLYGPQVADEVSALSELARVEHLRERAAAVGGTS